MAERRKGEEHFLLNLKKLAGSHRVDPGKFSKRVNGRAGFLVTMFAVLFIILIVKVGYITFEKSDDYKMQVLSQQQYSSTEIPYKRGAILDRNGAVLRAERILGEFVYSLL